MRFYKDPLFRRLVSGSVFAALFVWVAVRYFDVDTEVVWVLFVMSFVFVLGMMSAGLVFSFLIKLFRGKRTGMLDRLQSKQTGTDDAGSDAEEDRAREPLNYRL